MRHILFLLITLVGVFPISAREVYNLDREWRFFFASEQSADEARIVTIPHTWSGEQSIANYARSIYAPEAWSEKRVFVKFAGVQRVTDIFVNGKYVGEHRGGATAFTFEITDFLRFEANNNLMVVVNGAPQSDLLPTSVEHDIESGIYRNVELLVTPKCAISPLYYGSSGVFVSTSEATPSHVKGDVKVLISQRQTSDEPCEVKLTIRDAKDVVVYRGDHTSNSTEGESVSIPFDIKKAKLWSPSSPDLYTFEVELLSENDSDKVSVRSGFRTIEATTQGYIKINDKPTNIKGVTLYHDHPAVGSALTPKEYDSDMAIIRDMGATAIRSAVYPHDQYLYNLCDKEGVMAWIELPLYRSPFLSDIAYFPTHRFRENGREQLREIIAQNYNHPSVIMWGLFSVLMPRGDDFVPYLNELNEIASTMDYTRPTVAMSNQNGDLNSVTDLIVWRQNIGWDRGALSDISAWSSLLHSKWGHMASAVSYGEAGSADHQEGMYPSKRRPSNSRVWATEARARSFHEGYAAVLDSDSLFWGVWINNMFDFKSSRTALGENTSGVVSFDREVRKDIFYLYKSLWRHDQKIVHIVNRRDNILSSPLVSITAYASDNESEPIVEVGDKSYPMRRTAPSQFVADSVEIMGRSRVVVRQGKASDAVDFIYGSPLRAREN